MGSKTILISQLPRDGRWKNGLDSYEDNPVMIQGTIPDSDNLSQQHKNLFDGLSNAGDTFCVAFPEGTELYDFVFVRDSFLSNQKDAIILSNFREKKRSEEVVYMRECLEKLMREKGLPYTIHTTANPEMYIEGGEFRYIAGQNILIAGKGRNSDSGIAFVQETFNVPNENMIVLHGKGFHVDVYCSVVTDKNDYLKYIIACEDLIDEDELQQLEAFTHFHGAELLRVPPEYGIGIDGKGCLATNTLNVGNYLIGCNPFPEHIEEKLTENGIQRIFVNVSEYMKSGGAIHCLTNVL